LLKYSTLPLEHNMEYSKQQLDMIQRKVKQASTSLKTAKGFGTIMDATYLLTWTSHANLAGYQVDKETGRMYKEQGKVERTYYDEQDVALCRPPLLPPRGV
jgi:hypothetical protein